MDYFGSGNFDEEQLGTSNLSIALDTGDDPAKDNQGASSAGAVRTPRAGPGDDDLELYEGSLANAQAAQSAPSTPSSKKKWPTGKSPDPAQFRIDAVDVRVTADYGDPPESALAAPAYAIRVIRRKRALDGILKERSLSLADAEKQRDELLVRMVQDLRGKILMVDEGATLFEPIVAIERVALERRSALAGTSAEYDARVADLGERRKANDREMEDQRAVIEQRTASLAEMVRAFERADAKKKRLYIELGGLVSLSEKSGGKLTPQQSASVARLEAEILAQKPEVDATTRGVEASRSVLAAAEADLRKLTLAARELDRLRKAVDAELQKQIGARSQGVTEAEQQGLDAFAELGRKVLAEKGRLVDVRPEVLDAIARADQAVVDRAVELEKHVLARETFDSDALKKGIGILAGAAVALLAVAIVLLTR
ncbi:MAG TPA: hypothetical protein VF395_15805 [Polyangiaceae bacterium]